MARLGFHVDEVRRVLAEQLKEEETAKTRGTVKGAHGTTRAQIERHWAEARRAARATARRSRRAWRTSRLPAQGGAFVLGAVFVPSREREAW